MIPNLFSKAEIPNKLPPAMQAVIDDLSKAANKEDCLHRAYDILTNKYRGRRFLTFFNFPKLFDKNLDKIWGRDGYIYCTTLNYLLRVLLIKSEWFKEEDIKLKHSTFWYISIHQYLEIKIDNTKSVNVDPWGKFYGIGLGDYTHGFHTKTHAEH